ncbi:hypothetical protein PIB30_048264 [Stylosanthes scabra]|uniref:Uncharacterized protein n=1 Tax=Stylosanthes scabra TaxID=79078 RepID=A0ABU6QGC3_9FABA|nr:hypothetical protein [Stylosanthes scabra]
MLHLLCLISFFFKGLGVDIKVCNCLLEKLILNVSMVGIDICFSLSDSLASGFALTLKCHSFSYGMQVCSGLPGKGEVAPQILRALHYQYLDLHPWGEHETPAISSTGQVTSIGYLPTNQLHFEPKSLHIL